MNTSANEPLFLSRFCSSSTPVITYNNCMHGFSLAAGHVDYGAARTLCDQ